MFAEYTNISLECDDDDDDDDNNNNNNKWLKK
jgi:hypothetical protein